MIRAGDLNAFQRNELNAMIADGWVLVRVCRLHDASNQWASVELRRRGRTMLTALPVSEHVRDWMVGAA